MKNNEKVNNTEYEIMSSPIPPKSQCNQYMNRYFNSDGTILSESRYDKDGNLTKGIFFNSDGTIESEHRYDKDGRNLTKEIFFNSDGTIEREHRRDKDGNLTKVI